MLCDEISTCPIHFRNDVADSNSTDPFFVTYLGNVVVYSYLEFTYPKGSEIRAEAEAIAVSALFGLDVKDRAKELLLKVPAWAVTCAIRVGHGALSDAMPEGFIPDDSVLDIVKGNREDIEKLHASVVAERRK